jgi:hypothetical protein
MHFSHDIKHGLFNTAQKMTYRRASGKKNVSQIVV